MSRSLRTFARAIDSLTDHDRIWLAIGVLALFEATRLGVIVLDLVLRLLS
jgi:hypothetical protein